MDTLLGWLLAPLGEYLRSKLPRTVQRIIDLLYLALIAGLIIWIAFFSPIPELIARNFK
jgi:hypothetical protein